MCEICGGPHFTVKCPQYVGSSMHYYANPYWQLQENSTQQEINAWLKVDKEERDRHVWYVVESLDRLEAKITKTQGRYMYDNAGSYLGYHIVSSEMLLNVTEPVMVAIPIPHYMKKDEALAEEDELTEESSREEEFGEELLDLTIIGKEKKTKRKDRKWKRIESWYKKEIKEPLKQDQSSRYMPHIRFLPGKFKSWWSDPFKNFKINSTIIILIVFEDRVELNGLDRVHVKQKPPD
ncbi:hypothetical protein Hanom_Chr04g00339711 [Helianthus anomalus]